MKNSVFFILMVSWSAIFGALGMHKLSPGKEKENKELSKEIFEEPEKEMSKKLGITYTPKLSPSDEEKSEKEATDRKIKKISNESPVFIKGDSLEQSRDVKNQVDPIKDHD